MNTPADRVGLCLRCLHARRVPSRTIVYWRCALAETDARFERYPRLPIRRCGGFVTVGADPEGGAQEPDEDAEARAEGPDGDPPRP